MEEPIKAALQGMLEKMGGSRSGPEVASQCPVKGLCVGGIPVAAEMCLFSEDTADVLRDRMPRCLQKLLSSGSEKTCTYVHTSCHIHTLLSHIHTYTSGEGEYGKENLLTLGGKYTHVNHRTRPTCLYV